MELVLRSDVENLGRIGDIVQVANGYARNYLLPRKLATTVTPENLRLVALDRARAEEVEKERRKQEEAARENEQAESSSEELRDVDT